MKILPMNTLDAYLRKRRIRFLANIIEGVIHNRAPLSWDELIQEIGKHAEVYGPYEVDEEVGDGLNPHRGGLSNLLANALCTVMNSGRARYDDGFFRGPTRWFSAKWKADDNVAS